MPQWLNGTETESSGLEASDFVIRLLVSLFFGACVALVYRVSHGRQQRDRRPMCTTLVLLSVLIAMVSIVIGGSVAKAFSLVGALSIVRFRTVVEDTRDTAFVIFAVVVGMAAGSGHFLLPAIGIPILSAAAFAMSYPVGQRPTVQTVQFRVRLGLGRQPQTAVLPLMAAESQSTRLLEVSTAKQGAAIDYTYCATVDDLERVAELAQRLAQLEGVQSVDVRCS